MVGKFPSKDLNTNSLDVNLKNKNMYDDIPTDSRSVMSMTQQSCWCMYQPTAYLASTSFLQGLEPYTMIPEEQKRRICDHN